MSRKKKKPCVLMIEGTELTDTLILTLDDLASNNRSLKNAMNATGKQLDRIRNIMRGL